MSVSITIDFSSAYEHMNTLEKYEFPKALSSAMTRSMFLISNKYLRKEIDRYVEGGATRYSKSGILYQKASVEKLYANVHYANNPERNANVAGPSQQPLPRNIPTANRPRGANEPTGSQGGGIM